MTPPPPPPIPCLIRGDAGVTPYEAPRPGRRTRHQREPGSPGRSAPVSAVTREPLVKADPGGVEPPSPCLLPPALNPDLQKYKCPRNRTLPMIACKTGSRSPIWRRDMRGTGPAPPAKGFWSVSLTPPITSITPWPERSGEPSPSPTATSGASSGEGKAAALTRGNRPVLLAGSGLGIRFPKGNSPPIFRNRPLPEIACKRGKSARFLPYVLSSKRAEKFPKGNPMESLYTGMAS